MPNQNYDYDSTVPIGDVGEAFVYRHFRELLLPGEELLSIKTSDEIWRETGRHGRDEGGDIFVSVKTQVAYSLDGRPVPVYLPGILDGIIVRSGVEVKTINNFISRNNNDDLPAGTTEIELWEDKYQTRAGWAVRIMGVINEVRRRFGQTTVTASDRRIADFTHDGLYERLTETGNAYQAILPGYLIYVYLTSNQEPFACVVLRNVLAFFDRVAKVAKEEHGFTIDPTNWPLRRDARDFIAAHNLRMCGTGNTWHIDFRKFEDLAEVYMIGDHPDVTKNNRSYYAQYPWTADIRVQQQRLENLRRLADGKRIQPT